MALARPTRTRLAKALHAYIRAVPGRELPRELRRWQGFRPQAIGPHVDEMVASLDDDGLRERILEWLDEKPSLRDGDAELLRLAAEREDGWEVKVDAGSEVQGHTKSTTYATEKLRERLEREQARTAQAKNDLRKAKEEVRRAKDEARGAQQADKKTITELNSKVRDLSKELERERAARKKLEGDVERLRAASDRDARRDRRAAKEAVAARDDIKAELRDARKEITQLQRSLREAERRPKKKTAAKAPRPKKPARRKMLRAPKGRFEDAPETLTEWLAAPDVRVLIDGYNVTKAPSGFGDLDLEAQRERLIDTAVGLARKHSVPMTIVFDGSEELIGTKRRSRQGVKVEYSKRGEIADDHLIALLSSLPADPVIVVTNDKELQHRARKEGATVATSDQFLALRR